MGSVESRPGMVGGGSRRGGWKVTVRLTDGKRFHYRAETEKDADLMALAVQFHGKDVAEAVVEAAD